MTKKSKSEETTEEEDKEIEPQKEAPKRKPVQISQERFIVNGYALLNKIHKKPGTETRVLCKAWIKDAERFDSSLVKDISKQIYQKIQ